MEKQDRKAATTKFKEQVSTHGIYGVICTASGEVWVGISRNLVAQQNSLWFALRYGGSPFAALKAAWAMHGEREFRFEELDRMKDDFSEILRGDELKKRKALWMKRLQASSL